MADTNTTTTTYTDLAATAYNMAKEIWLNDHDSLPGSEDFTAFLKLVSACSKALKGHRID